MSDGAIVDRKIDFLIQCKGSIIKISAPDGWPDAVNHNGLGVQDGFQVSYVSNQTIWRLVVIVTLPKGRTLTAGLFIAFCGRSLAFEICRFSLAGEKSEEPRRETRSLGNVPMDLDQDCRNNDRTTNAGDVDTRSDDYVRWAIDSFSTVSLFSWNMGHVKRVV